VLPVSTKQGTTQLIEPCMNMVSLVWQELRASAMTNVPVNMLSSFFRYGCADEIKRL